MSVLRVRIPLRRLPLQLVELADGEPVAERIKAVRNSLHESIPGHAIPTGGFWTSTVDTDGNSAWIRGPGNGNHYLLSPAPARVYMIDGYTAAKTLAVEYAAPSSERTTPGIDWPAVTVDYDAIHLSDRGLADCCRIGRQEPENMLAAGFESWDCESTLWFRWCFEHVERAPVR